MKNRIVNIHADSVTLLGYWQGRDGKKIVVFEMERGKDTLSSNEFIEFEGNCPLNFQLYKKNNKFVNIVYQVKVCEIDFQGMASLIHI